jgi:hypothetical protein
MAGAFEGQFWSKNGFLTNEFFSFKKCKIRLILQKKGKKKEGWHGFLFWHDKWQPNLHDLNT